MLGQWIVRSCTKLSLLFVADNKVRLTGNEDKEVSELLSRYKDWVLGESLGSKERFCPE